MFRRSRSEEADGETGAGEEGWNWGIWGRGVWGRIWGTWKDLGKRIGTGGFEVEGFGELGRIWGRGLELGTAVRVRPRKLKETGNPLGRRLHPDLTVSSHLAPPQASVCMHAACATGRNSLPAPPSSGIREYACSMRDWQNLPPRPPLLRYPGVCVRLWLPFCGRGRRAGGLRGRGGGGAGFPLLGRS